MGPDAMILFFWMLYFKQAFLLSSFTFIKRLLSSSSLFAITVVSSAYLRLLTFHLVILIPACASASQAFLMMYSAAAAAKSLQSCPTLCDPIDSSPPGSAIPGIFQARTPEWVAISFSSAWKWKVKSESEVAQSCPTLCDPMDCSLPGSSIHGIFQASVLEWGAIAFSGCTLHIKLNKQGENIQPWCTPFLIWNQYVIPCSVPTVASWPAYRFLWSQVRWSGITIS